MIRAIKKQQKCASFALLFPPFLGAFTCSLQRPRFASCFADIQQIETSSGHKVFAFEKRKTSRKLQLSMKKIKESWQNNCGRGKTEQDVLVCTCTFFGSYFACI